MIQFNLLPDVKINYLKARAFKQRILSVSMIVMAASIGLVAFVFFIQLGQKKNIKDLTNDIQEEKMAIQANEDINKVLTVQNQLKTLPDLHGKKPVTSRFFDYLNRLTPSDVKLTAFDVNVESATAVITGNADNLEQVNRYIDTLKFATFKTESGVEGKPFLTVAATLNRSSEGSSFEVSTTFDPVILDAKEKITLVIPQITTTRSELEKPTELFEESNEEVTQ